MGNIQKEIILGKKQVEMAKNSKKMAGQNKPELLTFQTNFHVLGTYNEKFPLNFIIV